MGGGSPCGACKFLRRKCAAECVFAPYFCSEQSPARFAAIHKVFGASNASKLLMHLPPHHRCEAAITIAYEAQARVRDPVYGCVAHIFAMQQQVAYLEAQVMQLKAQVGSSPNSVSMQNEWTTPGCNTFTGIHINNINNLCGGGTSSMESFTDDELNLNHMGELQQLALRMMTSN